ncbi:MAG: hypothetical protein C4289_08060 [Chloroflexota bacterium]
MSQAEAPGFAAAFDVPVGRFVYPRLPGPVAAQVMSELAEMDPDDLGMMGALDHPAATWAPSGRRVPERVLARVRDGIRRVARDVGFPRPLPHGDEWRFDCAAGRVLYETMDIVPNDAATEGVWSFLTLVVVPEIGPWRFPGRARDRLLGKPRNVLRRLWWRAHVFGPDLDSAPPGQRPFGEDEFVSFMERPTIGGNRRLAREARDAVFRAGNVGLPRSELIRDVAKRLMRLTAFVAIDVLDDATLRGLFGLTGPGA